MPVHIEEFIERSGAVGTAAELVGLFERTIQSYGYDRYMYSMLTEDPLHNWHKAPSIVRNYPEDWMAYYVANDLLDVDPVRIFAFKARLPFAWKDLANVLPLSERQRQMLDMGSEAGLHDGIGVPFYGPFGEVAGVGLASSDPRHTVSENEMSMLNVIAHQFHNVYLGLHLGDEASPSARLTKREQEVLLWCAQGKSNWVIGEILGISEAAVKFHVANCIAKLGADCKITAVLKAIRLRLITP